MASLGSVVVIEQTIKAADYQNVIENQLHPYMVSVTRNGNGGFEHDNTPCQKDSNCAGSVSGIRLSFWLLNSADPNLKEHI